MIHLSSSLIAVAAFGAQFEVSVAPNGRDTASGTLRNPISLSAVCKKPLRPGTTVYLTGGGYKVDPAIVPVIRWKGTARSPIVVRSAPNEWAIIDGRLDVHGAEFVVFHDFEMTRADDRNTSDPDWWQRPPRERPSYSGTDANLTFAMGGRLIELYDSKSIALINLYLHDNISGGGIGLWSAAADSLVYGCVITRNGWDDRVRGHGHGCYIQNGLKNESVKRMRHNVVGCNSATGMKVYGEKPDLRDVYFDGNVFFGNGLPSWTNGSANLLAGTRDGSLDEIVVRDNHFYQPDSATGDLGGKVYLGWGGERKGRCVFTGNHVYGGGTAAVFAQHWKDLECTGNKIYDDKILAASWKPGGKWNWDKNEYFGNGQEKPFSVHNRSRLGAVSFQEWKEQTGFDKNSMMHVEKPAGTHSFVIPNEFDRRRAIVVVYNWDKRARVEIDLSSILKSGDRYTLYNCMDYRGRPVGAGTFSGAAVVVKMRDDKFIGREFQTLVLHIGEIE